MFSSDVTEPKQRYEFLAIKREMLLKKTPTSAWCWLVRTQKQFKLL